MSSMEEAARQFRRDMFAATELAFADGNIDFDRVDELMADFALKAVSDREKEIVRKLRDDADNAYCDYIAQMRKSECLGEEAKMKAGTFGKAELDAHRRASELLGRHRALANLEI